MKKVNKDIYLGKNIFNIVFDFVDNFDRILIFSNKKVFSIYEKFLKEKLSKYDDKIFFYNVEDGEEFKNLDSISEVINFMSKNNFSRKSLVLCFGGGVICDMGGFIASIYMRGIEYISIPTTLLSQVDASIGGKVAVNHNNVKNLIGHFKNPYKVIIDIKFLKTLEKKEIISGMSELIKHGYLTSKEYLKFLDEKFDREVKDFYLNDDNLEEIIYKSLKLKYSFVKKDPFEKDIRALLNFGHTYAHVLESYFNYLGYSHGVAVAKGIIFELEISYLRGNISENIIYIAKQLFKKYDIPCEAIYIEPKIFYELAKKDKKNSYSDVVMIEFFTNQILQKTNVSLEEISDVMSKYKFNIPYASIDIGTNSCRLLIAEMNEERNKMNFCIDRQLEVVKLGEGVNKNKKLKKDAIDRAITTLKKYKSTIENFKITEENILCFATSATRDAENKDEFIERVKKDANINIKCISGEEEASYSFEGVISDIDEEFKNDNYVVVDIGGGSTEFIFGNKKYGIIKSKSIDIGCVRITEEFFSENYSNENIIYANKKIENTFKEHKAFFDTIKNTKDFILIGVAGTITTQISVRDKMKEYSAEKINGSILSIEDIFNNIELFSDEKLRTNIVGLDKKREDVILAGTLILLEIFNIFEEKAMLISENDNLIGAIIENYRIER